MRRVLLLLCLLFPITLGVTAQTPNQKTGVLDPAQIQALFPANVYFSGQSASVQLRNASGVRWSEGKQTLFGLVDTGGYSSGLRERYQFYVLTDVPIEIAGKRLPPGAYGAGFVTGLGFELMDLGGAELFHAPIQHDADLKRPRPLQIIATGPDHYRLYLGRDFVDLSAGR